MKCKKKDHLPIEKRDKDGMFLLSPQFGELLTSACKFNALLRVQSLAPIAPFT